MFTLLFIIISIIYIGLGLPDSLFGSAWPAIFPEMNLPIGYASFVTSLISLGTVISSLFAARLINKFGTNHVTAVSTITSTISLLGFSLSNSMWWFLLLALPLGAGAGAIDAALNNYVAVRYSSMHMSFLHCFYGIGVALSPFIMSFALSQNNDWRLGYRIAFCVMVVISLIAIFTLPLWKKAKKKEDPSLDFKPKTLSLLQMAKMPAVRTAWIVFFFTVALEFTCGIWGCTYLVTSEGLSESHAALVLTFYYVGMTAGRFVSGLISKKIYAEKIIYIGYCIVGACVLLIALPIPVMIKAVALFMIGFGNGPTFPNLTFITPINFGREVSQSIIGSQMATCNLGILVAPALFGFFAEQFSTAIFPYYIVVLYVVMLISTIIYSILTKRLREQRKNQL